MTDTVLNVDVAVTPKGKSVDDGVRFAYSRGPDTPQGCVSREGHLNLNKLRKGTCDIGFTLTTPTISWSEGPVVGSFQLAFLAAKNGGKDTIWIVSGERKPNRPYRGKQFSGFVLGPGHLALRVVDKNDDRKTHTYALAVRAATRKGGGTIFRDDPRIMNRSI